jgi:hypothetical protein
VSRQRLYTALTSPDQEMRPAVAEGEKMKKAEMLKEIERMENYTYYQSNASFGLITRLLKGLDENDSDIEALTVPLFKQVVELLIDCYNGKDLLEWLGNNDYNPINNFSFADILEYSDYDTPEELEEAKENALMYDDENKLIVVSW